MSEMISLEGNLSLTNFTLLDGSKVRFIKDKNNNTIVYVLILVLVEIGLGVKTYFVQVDNAELS